MQPYEDKHLREKVSRIIARQKEGKIVIAAYKDGTGLLTRDDLGTGLARADYPYDYTVGKAGYLKYDSQLGAYLFITKPDVKPPPVLVNYRTLVLAEAELDVPGRRIHIHSGETGITFTGVQPWKGLYEVLREVNEELARVNAGVVIWKIIPREEAQTHVGERLYPEGVPALRNGQALAHVTGFAYDHDHTLVYAGLMGYKTSLESLRVTLASGKPVTMTRDGAGDVSLLPVDRYEQAWQGMPEYTSHHAAFVSRLALPGKWEPNDLAAYALVFRGSPDPQAELVLSLVERLKEALEFPILDEWAADLWRAACDRNIVQRLVTGGDCILGARIELQADWQGLLTELLKQGEILLTA